MRASSVSKAVAGSHVPPSQVSISATIVATTVVFEAQKSSRKLDSKQEHPKERDSSADKSSMYVGMRCIVVDLLIVMWVVVFCDEIFVCVGWKRDR